MTPNYVLVGCGQMGKALVQGGRQTLFNNENLCIVEQSSQHALINKEFPEIPVIESPTNIHKDTIIIFAVKPPVLDKIIHQYKPWVQAQALFLSVAAGKTLSFFQEKLGHDAAVVRAMPNIPAYVQKAITPMISNPNVTPSHREEAMHFMQTVGQALWINDEKQMDAITALSGSGPAFFCYMIESCINAAQSSGLSKDLAEKLTYQTFYGTAHLLEQKSISATQLRKQVTSPSGTTHAGLQSLMDQNQGLDLLMKKTIQAAQKRSWEMAE